MKHALKNVSKTLEYAEVLNDVYLNQNYVYIKDFDTYSDILLSCNTFYGLFGVDEVFLMPRRPILLDESLILENMFEERDLIVNLLRERNSSI